MDSRRLVPLTLGLVGFALGVWLLVAGWQRRCVQPTPLPWSGRALIAAQGAPDYPAAGALSGHVRSGVVEGSAAAYRRALARGFLVLDAQVRSASGGEVVVLASSSLLLIGEPGGQLEDMNAAQVGALELLDGSPLLTLSELVALLPPEGSLHLRLPQGATPSAGEAVAAILERDGAVGRAALVSSSEGVLKALVGSGLSLVWAPPPELEGEEITRRADELCVAAVEVERRRASPAWLDAQQRAGRRVLLADVGEPRDWEAAAHPAVVGGLTRFSDVAGGGDLSDAPPPATPTPEPETGEGAIPGPE